MEGYNVDSKIVVSGVCGPSFSIYNGKGGREKDDGFR